MNRGPSVVPTRCSGDHGQVAGIEVLPFGFLVFVSGALLFANAWGVIDARMAVDAAAREATRAYVESDDARGARTAAIERAKATMVAYGRDVARTMVAEPSLAAPFGRCVRVTITVAYQLPMIAVPFLGGFGGVRSVEGSFTEIVDPYRSGLRGPASC